MKKYAEIFERFFRSFLAVPWITYGSFRHAAMIVDKFLNLEVFFGVFLRKKRRNPMGLSTDLRKFLSWVHCHFDGLSRCHNSLFFCFPDIIFL